MYKTENLFKNTINEIQNLWKTNKNLSKFVSWPQDLKFTNSQNKRIAVTDKLSSWNINDQSSNSKIHKLISNLSQYVRWESGYYEKDVSKSFLNNYGFFELIGPTGHFETTKMALYVNFLDKNTIYPLHNHEAEELYYIVSGEAKFEDEKGEYKILTPTETRFHKSYEPHAITTYKKQILSFVIWKNKFQKVSKIFK
tara:strand:+ start:439 stop:1029 length:591 start_codon:yes stop_codon:yes gene_type:complete